MAWPLIVTKKPTRMQRTMRSAATWASTDNQRNWSPPIEITKPKAVPTNTSNAPVSIRRTPRTIGWYSAGTPRPRPINAQARAKKYEEGHERHRPGLLARGRNDQREVEQECQRQAKRGE